MTRRNRILVAIAAVAVVLIAVRAALPYVVKDYVNRTLQGLRRQGLIEVEKGRAAILDLPALKALGEYEPDYLYLERKSR